MLAKEILSLQHPLVKQLVQIRQNKKERKQHATVLFTGLNALKELAPTCSFERLFIERGYTLPFPVTAKETYIVSKEILKKITGLENPEEAAAEIEKPQPRDLSSLKRVLLLDHVSDPGNLGTLLRTALGFGWGVFVLEGSVNLFNDKVLRASKGAIFFLAFDSGDETHLQKLLDKQPWKLLAADAKGAPLQQASHPGPLLLAIGHEARGLSPFVDEHFEKIAIPMKNQTESLNAAVAGGILLYFLQESR